MNNLSKTQQELYDAMCNGVVCRFMPYMGRFNPAPYYFRNDTMKRCTAAVRGLIKRGMVERFDMDKFGGRHKVRVKGETK